ncbi:chitinase-like mite allergen Der p 18.0101 [Oppia nitens]|uniref:chitinase-like mite allergen Der p 18.0101 n=1 Tax=Oppia nitens TaxID=1686743 RepID=UPI0023DC38AA|nr:chitinase-like mite allergen Der p 18.0101 [Oppia nitens]
MLKNCLLLGSVLIVCLGQLNAVLDPKVVCYYEYWYAYRTGAKDGKMTVDDIDSTLCTHIVYSYQGIDTDLTVKIMDPWLMKDKHDLEHFAKNKGHAKAMVAIGGWSGSGPYQQVVSTPANRQTFVSSVVSYLKTYNHDGLFLDWSGITYSDDFLELLHLLHQEFQPNHWTLGLTLPSVIPKDFKTDKVDPYIDLIAIQTYDFHGSWEMEVGLQAPVTWQLDVMSEWFKSGATMDKLLLTIPFYGHTWLLADESKSEPGDKATGAGPAGPITQSPGKLGYNELCRMVKDEPIGWDAHRDEKEAEIYIVHKKEWITYEDVKSCESKTHLATSLGYGGVVVQALSNEDYRGECGDKYPLLKAVNKGLDKTPVTPPTHPPHPTEPTQPTPDPSRICKKSGIFKDPHDCHKYHVCEELFPGIYSDEVKTCPKGEGFDETTLKCIDQTKVPGCQ